MKQTVAEQAQQGARWRQVRRDGGKDIPFRGRGTFGAGVQRQTRLPASNGLALAEPGVLRLKFSILARLASSVLMEAARFRFIGRRGASAEW